MCLLWQRQEWLPSTFRQSSKGVFEWRWMNDGRLVGRDTGELAHSVSKHQCIKFLYVGLLDLLKSSVYSSSQKHVEPMAWKNHKIGWYTSAIPRQQLNKHVPIASSNFLIMQHGLQQWEQVVSMSTMLRSYLETQMWQPSSVQESVNRGVELVAEE